MSPRVCYPSSSEKKDTAKKIVNDFAHRTTGSVWPGLSRAKVAAGALVRIDDPDLISQQETNLCGPSCFVRSVALDQPETYARAIVDLYEKGSATIGHGGSRHLLKPSPDLRNYGLPVTARVDQSDWIILASLRDTDNWFLRYSSVDGSASAFTMPGTMVSWFVEAGYTDVREDTNLASRPSLSNAEDASNLLIKGYKVVLLISADMLETSTQDDHSRIPDHWVALTSPITFQDGREALPPNPRFCAPTQYKIVPKGSLSFHVYSWGSDRLVPKSGILSTKSFLDNYYGYVACKY
jgi:hypothetical protein